MDRRIDVTVIARRGLSAFVLRSLRLTLRPNPIMAIVKIKDVKNETPFMTVAGRVMAWPNT